MRRSLFAGIGVAGVLMLASCSPDQPSQQPLAPSVPSLAGGTSQCAGSFASEFQKALKAAFDDPGESDLLNQFAVIKNACPNVTTAELLGFIESMISYRTASNANAFGGQTGLVASITLYVTNAAYVRPNSAFGNQGGAAVLSPGEFMETFDHRARLDIAAGTTPSGPHLFTFEPRPTADCDGTTSLRNSGNCYDIDDYPDGGTYSPPTTLTLCLHSDFGASAIGHQRAGVVFNGAAEVLPEVGPPAGFGCGHTTAAIDGWLGREAGPIGRALAKAYDYLRPRPLFADDAGESGSLGFFSLVGGVLNDIFADNFDDPADFNDGIDNPDLGDNPWIIETTSPGFIQIQNGVVVLSQGQGACLNCPVFRLLGTRVNGSDNETVGTYEVTWQSTQTKPSVKEAPFVVLNSAGAEIARLSYKTESSQNVLRFNGAVVGGWAQNVSQAFKITVNLTTLNTATSNTVSLSVNDSVRVSNQAAPNATTLKQIGYVLTGVDAGILNSDNWKVTRLSDIPPQ